MGRRGPVCQGPGCPRPPLPGTQRAGGPGPCLVHKAAARGPENLSPGGSRAEAGRPAVSRPGLLPPLLSLSDPSAPGAINRERPLLSGADLVEAEPSVWGWPVHSWAQMSHFPPPCPADQLPGQALRERSQQGRGPEESSLRPSVRPESLAPRKAQPPSREVLVGLGVRGSAPQEWPPALASGHAGRAPPGPELQGRTSQEVSGAQERGGRRGAGGSFGATALEAPLCPGLTAGPSLRPRGAGTGT